MKLREIAHARSGDKGDTATLSVIAFEDRHYPLLEKVLTPERVKSHFSGLVRGEVTRYALPRIGALNFVMEHALSGGVTRSLALDAHGKCLSSALLEMEISEGPESTTHRSP
jgi:hypothetical protein